MFHVATISGFLNGLLESATAGGRQGAGIVSQSDVVAIGLFLTRCERDVHSVTLLCVLYG